jgi:hypothetical protein
MMQMLLFTNMGYYSSTHLTRISASRFLGKKRGKGFAQVFNNLHEFTMTSFLRRLIHIIMKRFIDFLQDLCSTAQRKERRALDIWILSEIEYLMVNSWNECS